MLKLRIFQSFIMVFLGFRGFPGGHIYYSYARNGITFSFLTGRAGGLITIEVLGPGDSVAK